MTPPGCAFALPETRPMDSPPYDHGRRGAGRTFARLPARARNARLTACKFSDKIRSAKCLIAWPRPNFHFGNTGRLAPRGVVNTVGLRGGGG